MKVSVPLFSIAFLSATTALAAEPAAPVNAVPNAGGATVQTVSPPPPEKIPDIDPSALYGGDIMFDVVRKGSKVGEHRMTFRKDANGDLNVRAEFHLKIEVVFITAYTFDYTAHEIWRGKQLVALAANANDDGKVTETKAQLDSSVFKVNSSTHGETLASSWIFATNHWNRGQVESTALVNTLTGKIDRVKIENKGLETVGTAIGPVQATHFHYTGDLHDTDTWYDKDGRWVKMSFKAKDGSIIEYICRRCGLSVGEQVSAGCLWITGAGKGIGRAVAWEYAQRGWTVAVSARTQADLDALVQQGLAAKLPGRIVAYPADVTDQDAMKQTFKSIEQDVGPLSQVLLNAGTHIPNNVRHFSVDQYRAIMEVNFMGVVNGLSAVIPTFVSRRAGHIGVVSSVAGYSGLPLASAYGSSKAALINMCEALKPELESQGVALSMINPGFVRTPLTDKNDFPMPFLIDADVAARHIYSGMEKRKFEIAFPLPFVLILKVLRMLPYGLYFRLIKKVTRV